MSDRGALHFLERDQRHNQDFRLTKVTMSIMQHTDNCEGVLRQRHSNAEFLYVTTFQTNAKVQTFWLGRAFISVLPIKTYTNHLFIVHWFLGGWRLPARGILDISAVALQPSIPIFFQGNQRTFERNLRKLSGGTVCIFPCSSLSIQYICSMLVSLSFSIAWWSLSRWNWFVPLEKDCVPFNCL